MYTRVLHPFNLFLHKFKMLLQSHAAYCHRPHSVYGGRCVVGLSPPTPLSPSFLFGAACASRPQFLWYFSLPSPLLPPPPALHTHPEFIKSWRADGLIPVITDIIPQLPGVPMYRGNFIGLRVRILLLTVV